MDLLDSLTHQIARISPRHALGRVCEIGAAVVRVAGLQDQARQGDRVRIADRCEGEVIALTGEDLLVLIEGSPEGLALGDRVALLGAVGIAPHDSWIGRVVDPYGRPLDGRSLWSGDSERSLRASAPPAASRRALGARLSTGLAGFDTLLPLVQGQRIGLFAGSGVGKSSLLGSFARHLDADVAVIALIGERGRELREFVEHVLGPRGMARSVIVTATSDQSALARRRCAYAGMAVAEYFRDKGLHVLFLADSITRFAEAHREIALAAGEAPALRGFPPSLVQSIMGLAERAGPGMGRAGDITAIFSVLVAGSDMEEPVADILRGVLDGHIVLDRRIAERGRYPAIDLLRSVSRSLPGAATEAENALIAETRRLMGAYDKAELMVQAGLYAKGSDPLTDRAIQLWPMLDAFLAESAHSGVAGSFEKLAAILGH